MPAPQTPYKPYADRFSADEHTCPTALEIVKDAGVLNGLKGKVVIITGATSGIGIETARALHATGAKIYLAVRNLEKGAAVIKDIQSNPGSSGEGELVLLKLDTASLASVRSAAKEFLSKEKTLNILVNNAGIMACPYTLTDDGLESQIATNHFGHFLFFQLLKDTMLSSSSASFQSRVIDVASSGHALCQINFDDIHFKKGDYNTWNAYGQSKLANIYMASSIERHYGAKGLHAFSLHPGVILTTGIASNMDPAQAHLISLSEESFGNLLITAEQGAATTVWAAVSPDLEGRGGTYLADVGEASPREPGENQGGPGYAPYAYDEELEEKLWKLSYETVGVPEE
ncbi:hypothetical protein AAFC00_000714 [Neodothiora populina]|uniref:NAD(P)-binding protein n=1 Tax=Neodothiora populina TaxID=2781224 RepID=A0ABR3PEY3_9PEZI